MSLTLKMLARDWRNGELRVLFIALTLAVTIVSGIALFADRLQGGIDIRSATFLAGDLVLQSSRAVPESWLEKADSLGLKRATVLRFPTMVRANDSMQLTSVTAVSSTYPLLGAVEISHAVGAQRQSVQHGPPPGEAWLDARLLDMPGIPLTSSFEIGDTELKAGALLLGEPDATSGLIAYGPRMLMNLADLAATGVIQPGSRVRYSYSVIGDEDSVAAWRSWLESRLEPQHRLMDLETSQPRSARVVKRVRSYLLLGGAFGVILAGIAVAISVWRYSRRHIETVAVLKSLGLSAKNIARLYAGCFSLLTLAAIVFGWAAGWGTQSLFFYLVADIIDIEMPPAGIQPFLFGAMTAIICVAACALPPLVNLVRTLPVAVLRREAVSSSAGKLSYLFGLLAMFGLLLLYSRSFALAATVLVSLLVTAGLLLLVVWGVLRRGQSLGMHAGSIWRLAMAGVQRHRVANALLSMVVAFSMLLLMVVIEIRGTLLNDWRAQIPSGTPNHFLVNIADWQKNDLRQFFSDKNIETAGLYPMVSGRLVAVNGKQIQPSGTEGVNLDRELNLTWMLNLPEDNAVIAGEWWKHGSGSEISVEKSMAEALDLVLGDTIDFRLGSSLFSGTVTSIRELDWEAMRPKFYVIIQPGLLQDYAATYITSFHLSADEKLVLNQLAQRFPTVSIIEMDVIISRLRNILEQAGLAVQLVMTLVLIAAALVVTAGIQGSLDDRLREASILRALGARRRLLIGSQALEFALLGATGGVIAALGASVALYGLQVFVFEMDASWHLTKLLLGPLLGGLVVAGLGTALCRRVLETPPVVALRMLDI